MTVIDHATKSKVSASQLSPKDCQEGIDILTSLQTVERAMRLNDPIPMAASNVVKNEQNHPEFVRFIRKVAGFEIPDQKAVIEELLVLCYETS
jgi:hypothetical protein